MPSHPNCLHKCLTATGENIADTIVTTCRDCGETVYIPVANAEDTALAKKLAGTILDEAARLTSTDLQRHYGHPRDNFRMIANMWTSYLNKKFTITAQDMMDGSIKAARSGEITPRDVAMMMVLMKVARDANMSQRDNLVDIAGYARTAEMLEG